MKILCVIENNPFPQSNAPSNRFISLIHGLSSNGCEINLLFTNGFLNKEEYTCFKNKGLFGSFHYEYLYSTLMKNKYSKKIFRLFYPNIFIFNKIKRCILNDKYDYVWLGVSPIIVKIGLGLFKYHLPVKFLHERSEYSWISIPNKNIHDDYLQNFLTHIDVMSVMTKKLIEYYKQYVGKRTSIIHIPMTVDFSRFDISRGETTLKQPYIAYCGSMDCVKDGVDILVKAFIKITDEFPQYHLYIAGSLTPEKDYNKIVEIIDKHKATDRISFLGFMGKDEIPQFLKNASILAMARPESQQSEGGFPTKLGEYLATGNPVCVTDIGEIRDYLTNQESAFISKPNCINSFSMTLKDAITSPIADDIGQNGRSIANKYFNKDLQSKVLFDFLTSKLK